MQSLQFWWAFMESSTFLLRFHSLSLCASTSESKQVTSSAETNEQNTLPHLQVFHFQHPHPSRLACHPLVSDHNLSRSYLPSAAGQAAYYQAETCGGLAVCQPLTRISNHHHFQGESPAEEVRLSCFEGLWDYNQTVLTVQIMH